MTAVGGCGDEQLQGQQICSVSVSDNQTSGFPSIHLLG